MGDVRKTFYFEQKETKGTKKADFYKRFWFLAILNGWFAYLTAKNAWEKWEVGSEK
jgi:hypothetical protein